MELNPPLRFALVAPGLTRGAYPTLRNFRALTRLRLRTIVSLVPEAPTEDLQSFASLVGIRIVHVPVQRTAPISSALQSSLITAVNACIDLDNHPIFLHCLDGRRITSMVVLLLRRLQGWLPMSALNEYWRFQSLSRSPSISLAEVEKNVREAENFASEVSSEVTVPENIPIWLWSGNRAVSKIQGVKLKHCPPLPEETTPSSASELEVAKDQEANGLEKGQEQQEELHSEERLPQTSADQQQQQPPQQQATDMLQQKLQESSDLETQQVQMDHPMLTTPSDESHQDQSEKRQEYEQELEQQQQQQQQQSSQVQPLPQQVSRAISALDLHGLETSRVVKKKNGQP